jgi:glutamyl-tRNA synthetase
MEAEKDPVRVRFAPSPTGHLHLGGARTALFNFLFARRHKGVFLLRVEDTDQERSTPESVRGILDSLRWLGLDWDEGPEVGGEQGPYFQSERKELYRRELERLLAEGKAYPCFCTPEELAARREKAKREERPLGYDGRCRGLDDGAREKLRGEGRPEAVRLAVGEGETSWRDLVRGDVSFRNDQFGDFVIFKSDGFPTYHFAVVVDDAAMAITHVIRGDDHISNTPRHLMLFEALGRTAPLFAHAPIILGGDGGRLSKRHGATSVGQYREEGYLPEAMVNYLALLGWSTSESRQTFSLEELIAEFDIPRVSKSSATFDQEKLLWLNNYHYLELSSRERVKRLVPFWEKAGMEAGARDPAWLEKIVDIVGDRVKVLPDIGQYTEFFFRDVEPGEPEQKVLHKAEKVMPALVKVIARLDSLEPFSEGGIETAIKEEAEAAEVGLGKIIQPIRVAVMGRKVGPGLFESLELLGKDKVLERLRTFFPPA